jgi:hypothetical protein
MGTKTVARCEYHEQKEASFRCTACKAYLCAACLYGDDPKRPLCPECHKNAEGLVPDRILTPLLFACAFPVAAPSLLFLALCRKRWKELGAVDWLCAQALGAAAAAAVLAPLLGYAWTTTAAIIAASAIAGTAFFLRDRTRRREGAPPAETGSRRYRAAPSDRAAPPRPAERTPEPEKEVETEHDRLVEQI